MRSRGNLNRHGPRKHFAAGKMAGLDPDQQAKLRQIIHEHLGSTDVYSRIRSFVREFVENEQGAAIEEDKLLATLHEKVCCVKNVSVKVCFVAYLD